MKIDIHVHTKKVKSGDSENRQIAPSKFCEIIQNTDVKICSITNHNHFDKEQYDSIVNKSQNLFQVWPGSESEILECLIDPINQASSYKKALLELDKTAWYLHQTQEGRSYFDHQENLTKKLQGYAEKVPQNKVDELIRDRLNEMYDPTTKEAYEKILPLPEMDEAAAALKLNRIMLIISPDGKVPPEVVKQFYENLSNKNNILVLTGEKSSMANLDKAARNVYTAAKADREISGTHPQRKELDEKKAHYAQDFQVTILNMFDQLFFPGVQRNEDILRSKVLDRTYPSNEPYNGERQVIKTLTADPIKLYTNVSENYDALRTRSEQLLFGNQDDARKTDLIDKMRQKTQMPWIPQKGLDLLIQEACQRGAWEDLGNGYITRKPKPKTTQVVFTEESSPDDTGTVRLKIDTINSGNAPRIHYQEDGEVSEASPVLPDNILTTRALRIQLLAIDPSGKNKTGTPSTWSNRLTIRSKFDEINRKVELFVAPKGKICYTLDGSEARNGTEYSQPFIVGDNAVTVYVFAECEGIEEKRTFQFAAKGKQEIILVKEKPTILYSPIPKKLDNTARTYEGLKIAGEKGIIFEQVNLTIGSAPKVIHLTLGEMRIQAEFIEKALMHFQTILTPEAPVIMSFKKIYVPTGFDLEQFAKVLGIELKNEEVIQ